MLVQYRIAIFLPSLRGGGAERAAINLANGILNCGYKVELILAQKEGPFLSELSPSIRIIDLKCSRIILALPGLVRYLRRERPYALLSIMNHVNLVAIFARFLARVSTRVVISEHEELHYLAKRSAKWRDRMRLFLMSHFYGRADSIVSVSDGVADQLSQYGRIPREKIQVIQNPIISSEICAKSKRPLSHPWFKRDSPPVVLSVGRLEKIKNFPLLIRAFSRIQKDHPVRLVILGEGEERPVLEKLVQDLGLSECVELLGFVDNPFQYMSRASLFVLASDQESSANVLVEAMYCGLPVIATDCAGPREILKNGRYGLLVPIRNETALADAMEKALSGKIPKSSNESWQSFERPTVVEEYLNVLVGEC